MKRFFTSGKPRAQPRDMLFVAYYAVLAEHEVKGTRLIRTKLM
jgi:hypothetical protein